MRRMKFQVSTLWQSATMAVIIWSFTLAVLGNENAMKLWMDGAPGIAVLLGGGVLGKMGYQTAERIAEKKYSRRPSGLPDGES